MGHNHHERARRRRTSLLAAAAALAASLSAVSPPGAHADAAGCPAGGTTLPGILNAVVDHAAYKVHTEYRAADGTITSKDTSAIVGVPMPVSPRPDGLVPDLLVTVLPSLDGTVTMRVTKLPLAPAALPVRVEGVFPLADGKVARLGYDTADVAQPTADDPFRTVATTAPGNWALDADVQQCDAGTFLTLTQKTASRSVPLELVGSLTTPTTVSDASVALSPVPATTRLTAAITDVGGASRTTTATFGVAPSSTTTATVDARLAEGKETTVHAELPDLPSTAVDTPSVVVGSLDKRPLFGTALHRVSLRSVARLSNARVVLRQKSGARVLLDTTAVATHLPHAFSVDISEGNNDGLTEHQLTYAAEPFQGQPEKLDRLVVDANLSTPVETLGPQPDTTSVHATAVGVPSDLQVRFTPPDPDVAPGYLATSLSTAADGGDAGPPIDSLDVRLARDDGPSSLGTDEVLSAGQEGVLVRTTKGIRDQRQTVHLHVTGPKLLTLEKSSPTVDPSGATHQQVHTRLVTDPGAPDRSFRVRLEGNETATEPPTYADAFINPLPAGVTVDSFTDESAEGDLDRQRVHYTATEATDSIQFETDKGPRDLLRAELHKADDGVHRVPATLDFCVSPLTARCAGGQLAPLVRDQKGLSLLLSTVAGELHGSVFDCVDAPPVGACDPSNASRFKVARLNIVPRGLELGSHLALDLHMPPVKGGEKGHVFVDTGQSEITSGSFEVKDTSTDPCSDDGTHVIGTLKRVLADNRFAVTEVQNIDCLAVGVKLSEQSGSMTCGAGTVIDVAPGKSGGDLANDFCRTP